MVAELDVVAGKTEYVVYAQCRYPQHVHLQGNDGKGFSLLKDSLIDYGALIGRLREDGFDGVLSVEFVKDCHPKNRADYSEGKVVANAAADLAFIREAWGP